MNRRKAFLGPHPFLRALISATLMAPVLIVSLPPEHATAMPSAGCRTMSFGAGNDAGASADDVRSVA